MERGMPAGCPARNGLCPDAGAGDGNRTHATSLEGWDSTIELHPHGSCSISHFSSRILPHYALFVNPFFSRKKIMP